MKLVLKIAQKEFAGFFASPTAFIFLGAFLAVTLFTFFWVETFFARNIADVRPLFEWMPLLMIFLAAAITMRMWSEERRSGTLEFLLTAPVSNTQLVLGKFLACFGLVAVALVLTLPVPFTVSLIGLLDWGPVLGGYLATLFLAAAYLSIGLFVSARSSNQIVSLIVTTLICGFFYLLGSDSLTSLFGNSASEWLKSLGSSSRFESITRGMLDVRDIFYYLSLVGVFLALNVFTLESLRWAGNPNNARHRRWMWLTGVAIANFMAANLWLAPINQARVDMTAGQQFSISEATRGYLAQLQEPMLIRGYFSAQTHPLLAPLVPRLRDLLQEYAIAGEGRLRVEFIDPQQDPELEQEANQKYQIKPIPFQFASKYQSSVVNSYFNILIQYGDEHQVLGFRDLIDIKLKSETDLDVELRNPEYDLTQAIKKVLYAYQGAGDLFANLTGDLTFKGYISADGDLPEVLQNLRQELDDVLADAQNKADGRLTIDIQDPEANDGALAAQLKEAFGFRPMSTGLFSTQTFWFYMTLESAGRTIQVPLPENFDKAGLELGLQAALKRFSSGFLKTVAVHMPTVTPAMPHMGLPAQGQPHYVLRASLEEERNLINTDLKSGQVPEQTDLLMLINPDKLDDKQLFAVDQFLMRGGAVVMATSPYRVDSDGALSASAHDAGLADWLAHHGLKLDESLVMDPQNAAFPIPVNRDLGGFVIRETKMVNYPYFVDIRQDGLAQGGIITGGLNQVTMTWPSPIDLDEERLQQHQVTPLLRSTEDAWTSTELQIQPDFNLHGDSGFAQGEPAGQQLLAVAVEGRFESYFKDKPSPFAANPAEENASDEADDAQAVEAEGPVITRVIDQSPASARIILFASNNFVSDLMLDLAASGLGTEYRKPIELIENTLDWSLEDRGLLEIRGRAHFSRVLDPLGQGGQVFWEYLNYGLAMLGLLLIWLIRRQQQMAKRLRQARLLAG